MNRRITFFTMLVALCATVSFAQEDEPQVYEPPRDFGVDVRPSVLFGITPEDGLVLGGGPIIYKFGFRRMPYVFRMQIVGGVAVKTGAFKFEYTTLYPALSEKLSLENVLRASALEVRSFYGFGNESSRDEDKEDSHFYRVALTEYLFRPTLFYKVSSGIQLGFSTFFKGVQIKEYTDRYFTPDSLNAYGSNRSMVGTAASFQVDVRDRPVATTNGMYLLLEAGNHLYPFRKERPFQRLSGNIRGYATLPGVSWATFAIQAGGTKLHGDFPFYESAFLGGFGTLRGFNSERFAGDASAFGSAELRFSLFRMKILVPAHIGIFGLIDAGRVWMHGQPPAGWHIATGGGLSIAPLAPENTLTLTFANSKDGLFFLAGFGYGF